MHPTIIKLSFIMARPVALCSLTINVHLFLLPHIRAQVMYIAWIYRFTPFKSSSYLVSCMNILHMYLVSHVFLTDADGKIVREN